VLTVDPGTSKPVNQLDIQPENLLAGGYVDSSEMFRISFGPYLG
jgi:hypothetical protein